MPRPETVPSDFRYWANLDRPWASMARAAARRLWGFDLAPSADVVREFGAMYYDEDPLAAAFVEEVYQERGSATGRALLDQALAGGLDSVQAAPTSLVNLFESLRDPEWLDREMVKRGARVFRRYGPSMFHFAGAITLVGYSESSVAKPLALTGAYAGDSARHRFLETAAFWIAVSEPGGLEVGAAGRASALRVRVMHAQVRRRLLAHPEWDQAAWGVPISHADSLMTLLGGSFIPGVAMRAMGFRPTAEEIEASLHFWRYVGHLMGVQPRWFPSTLQEAAQLAFVSMVKAAHGAGEDEGRLCRAFERAFTPDPEAPLPHRVADWWRHGLHRGYTRFFLPGKAYRRNGLSPAGLWSLHPLAQFPFIFTAETLRRRFRPLDEIADRVARRSRNRWFARHAGDRTIEYSPVAQLTR